MGGSARSDTATRLRLASGLVLMTFVATHLLNHTLGIVSLAAMQHGRELFVALWRSWPGTVLLYGALLGHALLAVHKLYRRRSLSLPAWEWTQIGLGLLIPVWLAAHVAGSRILHVAAGQQDDYVYMLDVLWPDGALRQTALVLVTWLHGCIGIHFWLRLRPWYRRASPWLLAVAVLLPVLALIGFVNGGREVQSLADADPAWLRARAEQGRWLAPAEREAFVGRVERTALTAFATLLVAVAIARAVRGRRGRRSVRLTYPDGTSVALGSGMSVLEASRSAGVPHAAVCGGRGRCSTCRVRVTRGGEDLAPPAADEAKVLKRIGAGGDIRLACQLRPTRDLTVVPLLPAGTGPRGARVPVDPGQGIERTVAVLFADLRAFTRMAEGRLSYDVVFVLNQYFKTMGQVVEDHSGRVDKFIGDGIMALFGVETEPGRACRGALAAARAMSEALVRLNGQLAGELSAPLRMALGLHVGPVILGEMGYGRAASLTAIGDTVNVASRLETLAKEFGAELVVSARVAEAAGVELAGAEAREVEIRGRQRPLRIRVMARAAGLPLAWEDEPAAPRLPPLSALVRLAGLRRQA
jgi:adenylate cyclase